MPHTTQAVQVAGLEGTEFKLVEGPIRLVVFIHGFRGDPVGSWKEFDVGSGSEWWDESDLLFVGYASQRLDPLGVANAVRGFLERVFPHLPDEYVVADGIYFRPPDIPPYSELVLVGHSLGGLIARRVAVDIVHSWERAGAHNDHPLLANARMCLFSPATAGFAPTGNRATLYALIGPRLLAMALRNPPDLRDLRPGSVVLSSSQRVTEQAARAHGSLRLLFPEVVWANPDQVVSASDYDTDVPSHSELGVTHRTVCKPHASYTLPWEVVESGSLS